MLFQCCYSDIGPSVLEVPSRRGRKTLLGDAFTTSWSYTRVGKSGVQKLATAWRVLGVEFSGRS